MIATLVYSCEKDNKEKIWAYYQETQCSNPWDNISSESTESKVEEYLKQNGIALFEISIIRYSYGPFCTACTCPSGRGIQVLILESDVDTIKNLGFSTP